MAAFRFRQRRTRHWWTIGVTIAVTALGMVFYVAGSGAFPVGSSTFNAHDANLIQETVGTNTDWCNRTAAQLGTGSCPTANLAPNFTSRLDKTSGSTDDSFGQGAKEDGPCPTEVTGSIPPQKSDLTRFYTAHEKVNGHEFLYLAWERSNILGNANMDFEFNQSSTMCSNEPAASAVPTRTNGDLLVTYDFGGSGTPTLSLNFWLDGTSKDPVSGTTEAVSQCFSANSFPCWGDHTALTGTNSDGSSNSANVSDPIAPNAPRTLAGSSSGGTFGEAEIDLTGAIPNVFGSNPTSCESFGSAYLKSRSSSSFTAEQKDFIAPATVSLNNCGSLLIYKTDGNGSGLAGATFTAEPGQLTNGGVQDSSTFTDEGNGYYCLDNMKLGQSTTVTETVAPAGYNVDPTPQTITVSSSDSCSTRLAADTITADGDDFVDTPQLGAIEVTKESIKSSSTVLSGATFTVKDSGGTLVTGGNLTTGTDGTACVDGLPFGTYTVTETGAPDGYGIDTTTGQSVTVNAQGTCSTGTQATKTFTDSPLADVVVTSTSESGNNGDAKSKIACRDAGNHTVGTDVTTFTDPASDEADGLKPGTYTCTITIDP